MAGLKLYGGVSAAAPQSYTGAQQPSSVASAAFGPGYSTTAPSTGAALAPNDAFGMSFWAGVAAIALLVFIRQTLPR